MSIEQAQRAYDNEHPPHDCEVEGHSWVYVGTAPDGAVFYKCRYCPATEEG